MQRIPFERAYRASTTHRYDYMDAYIGDLVNVVDVDVLRSAHVKLGVDPALHQKSGQKSDPEVNKDFLVSF